MKVRVLPPLFRSQPTGMRQEGVALRWGREGAISSDRQAVLENDLDAGGTIVDGEYLTPLEQHFDVILLYPDARGSEFDFASERLGATKLLSEILSHAPHLRVVVGAPGQKADKNGEEKSDREETESPLSLPPHRTRDEQEQHSDDNTGAEHRSPAPRPSCSCGVLI